MKYKNNGLEKQLIFLKKEQEEESHEGEVSTFYLLIAKAREQWDREWGRASIRQVPKNCIHSWRMKEERVDEGWEKKVKKSE